MYLIGQSLVAIETKLIVYTLSPFKAVAMSIFFACIEKFQHHKHLSSLYFRPQHPPRPKGHVIAARITAENPDEVRETD